MRYDWSKKFPFIPDNPCLDCEYNAPNESKKIVCLIQGAGQNCWRNFNFKMKLKAILFTMECIKLEATGTYKDCNGNDMQALPLSNVDRNLDEIKKIMEELNVS